jgi:hypothetical protein
LIHPGNGLCRAAPDGYNIGDDDLYRLVGDWVLPATAVNTRMFMMRIPVFGGPVMQSAATAHLLVDGLAAWRLRCRMPDDDRRADHSGGSPVQARIPALRRQRCSVDGNRLSLDGECYAPFVFAVVPWECTPAGLSAAASRRLHRKPWLH